MKNTELLVYMLEDIRKVTLKGVSGLTKEQLFTKPIQGEFPIGAYLMHLAEVDLFWLNVLNGIEIDAELKKRSYSDTWFDSGDKFNPPKVPIEIEEYLDVLQLGRSRVLEYIKSLYDNDLEEIITQKWMSGGVENSSSFSRKWVIYHLIEHEAHTRGQMFMLIRMAGFKKKGENN